MMNYVKKFREVIYILVRCFKKCFGGLRKIDFCLFIFIYVWFVLNYSNVLLLLKFLR